MDLISSLRRQFAHDEWANREAFKAICSGPGWSARSLQLLAHIVSAENLWLERIQRKPQSLPVWPEFAAEECEQEISKTASAWREYLSSLSVAGLAEPVTYQNSKGEGWNSRVDDVLTHVLLHSAYHRGQIAMQLRGEGTQPAYTDFIHAARNGLIE